MPRPRGGQRALGPYRHGDRWRVVSRETDGTRRDQSFASKTEALEFADEYNTGARTVATTLDEALDAYRIHFVDERGNKPTSWPETERRIRRMLAGVEHLDDVTPKHATERYRALTLEMAVDSHRGCLTATKTFFSWALGSRQTAANPFAAVTGQGRKKRGKAKLRHDEAVRFRDAALTLASSATGVDFERHLMALASLYLGTRASELTTRQVRDVDADCTRYVIPDAKTPSGRRVERIPDEIRPLFRRLVAGRAGDAPLFAGRYGAHHDHRYVTRYCVVPLCEALGLPRVTAHGLRGTFADLALEEGTASLAVARSLGHASYAVTAAHYADPSALHDAQARRVLDALNRCPTVSASVDNDSGEKR